MDSAVLAGAPPADGEADKAGSSSIPSSAELGGREEGAGNSLMDVDEATRERQRRKQSSTGAVMEVPPMDSYLCPLSGEVIDDPVRIASGNTFDRKAIEKYFADGGTTCPVSKEPLPNFDLVPDEDLAKKIDEWRARNTVLRIQAARPRLQSQKEEEVEAGLLDIFQLCQERSVNRSIVASEGLIQEVVALLKSTSRNLRRKTLATLTNLATDNEENKELIVDAGSIPAAVRSLARDAGESRQGVALLLELSKSPKVCEEIGRVQGSILLLVTNLNSENANTAKDAAAVLQQLASNDQNVVQMAEANHFKPLAERLSSGSDMTAIVMASALSRMSLTDQSRAALVQQGVLPPLVSMVANGKLEAKAAALGALKNLSQLPGNRVDLIKSGLIPPLLTLIFSVTSVVMSLKEGAAAILSNVAGAAGEELELRSDPNAALLQSEETISKLLSLLVVSGPNIQDKLLETLLGLAAPARATAVRAHMISGGAIDVLVPFVDGTEGNNVTQPLAAKLLKELSSDPDAGAKVAASLQEGSGVALKALVRMLQDKDALQNRAAAASLIAALPQNDTKLNQTLMQADVVSVIVSMLAIKGGGAGAASLLRDAALEGASNALVRFTLPSNVKLQQQVAEMGAIPLLVTLLLTGNAGAKRGAALCLGNFSESSPSLSVPAKPKSGGCCFKPPEEPKCIIHNGTCGVKTSFCLLEAEAVEALVSVLGAKEAETAEAALVALSTLMTDNCRWEASAKIIHEAGGFNAVVQQLSAGNERSKEKGVWMLEKLFRLEEYRFEYATKAQGALIEITQHGSNETKPVAAKILSHLELLHQQSSYF